MPDDPHEGGPGGDVLYRGVALPHAVRLPILGIPVRFMSNSVAARDAVVEWCGMWEQLEAHPDLIAAGEVRGRIVLHEGADEAAGRVPMRYRMPDHDRVIVHTPGSVGIVDVSRRDAIAYVTAVYSKPTRRENVLIWTECPRRRVKVTIIFSDGVVEDSGLIIAHSKQAGVIWYKVWTDGLHAGIKVQVVPEQNVKNE